MAEAAECGPDSPSTSGRVLEGPGRQLPHRRQEHSAYTISGVSCPQSVAGSEGQEQGGRLCRLRWARCSLGRGRLLGGLAPPCLTSPTQLALLLLLLPALLYPTSLLGPELARDGLEGRGAGGTGGGGTRSRPPLAGAAAQAVAAAAGQPNTTNLGASAWLLMGGLVENTTNTAPDGQCGLRYTGMVEFAGAGCNRHEYK